MGCGGDGGGARLQWWLDNDGCWSVLSGLEEEGEGEREVRWRKNRGERKKYKIIKYTTTITV